MGVTFPNESPAYRAARDKLGRRLPRASESPAETGVRK
jgi:hypothetical protein